MSHLLYSVRDRIHPLNFLRRHNVSRAFVRIVDVPIWTKMSGINWPVRVRLVRHASTFILPEGVEPAVSALFRVIGQEIGIHHFWDVGANIGYYSWLVKSLAPEAQVRIFEPDPDNLTLVRATLRRASLHGVTVRDVAVSDTCGLRQFIRDEVSGATGGIREAGSTFSERYWGVVGSTITIGTISLDEERVASPPVDLIKIDVEGHEEAVIRGARTTIQHDRPVLIFECFHGGAEIINYLGGLGYRIADAERINEHLNMASNFLAVPPRHLGIFDGLRQHWRDSLMRAGHRT